VTQIKLEARLWFATSALRGPIDPGDFENYVFPMLFWKKVSDVCDWEHEQVVYEQGQGFLDPHIGALTQIVNRYKPIDTIVKQADFTGNETQDCDRTVRNERRLILKKYALPHSGPLLNKAYASISENY
jgi:hypothetical protein